MAAPAENIGCQTRLADGQAKDKVSAGIVDKSVMRRLGKTFGLDPQITVEKELQAGAGPQMSMPDDPIAGQVVQGVLADGAEYEHIQRQIVCSIQIAGVGVAPMMINFIKY